MPRPPVLPTVEWKTVVESGKDFDDWISSDESTENCKKILKIREEIKLAASIEAYLKALSRPIYVVVIAEAWCDDVVRHVPVMQRIADAAPAISVKYIFREQHPSVFARFLTNGGEAVPKFVFLSDQYTECGNWGPMPEFCREIIARGKACGDIGAARKKTSTLYDADPGKQIVIRELLHLIDIASSESP